MHELTQRGVTVRSLHDGVDTSTSTGRMVAGILMSIAEYERELVRERTALKLEHARKSGRKFGRPAKLTSDQAALAQRMKANGETAATICQTLGIGRTTLYRYLGESAEDVSIRDSQGDEGRWSCRAGRSQVRRGQPRHLISVSGRRSRLAPGGGRPRCFTPGGGIDQLLTPGGGPTTTATPLGARLDHPPPAGLFSARPTASGIRQHPCPLSVGERRLDI